MPSHHLYYLHQGLNLTRNQSHLQLRILGQRKVLLQKVILFHVLTSQMTQAALSHNYLVRNLLPLALQYVSQLTLKLSELIKLYCV